MMYTKTTHRVQERYIHSGELKKNALNIRNKIYRPEMMYNWERNKIKLTQNWKMQMILDDSHPRRFEPMVEINKSQTSF